MSKKKKKRNKKYRPKEDLQWKVDEQETHTYKEKGKRYEFKAKGSIFHQIYQFVGWLISGRNTYLNIIKSWEGFGFSGVEFDVSPYLSPPHLVNHKDKFVATYEIKGWITTVGDKVKSVLKPLEDVEAEELADILHEQFKQYEVQNTFWNMKDFEHLFPQSYKDRFEKEQVEPDKFAEYLLKRRKRKK